MRAGGDDPGTADPAPRGAVHGVLLVDDVGDLRVLYRLVLEATGRFEVVGEAGDGIAAVELARALQPDLVTLDVSMPGRDGMEVLPEIREAAPRAAVVVITGFETRGLGRMARERGATAFLEKGLTPRQLSAALLRIMEARVDGDGRR